MMLKFYKMNIVIPLLMIFTTMNEFTDEAGSHHEEINWTSELDERLFDVFNKTSPYSGDHPKRMHKQWNRENPSHKVLNYKVLCDRAWSVIENKCRKWENETGVDQRRCEKLLSCIYHETAKSGTNRGQLMYEKFIRNDSRFQHVNEDLSWSVLHNWYRYNAEEAALKKNQVTWTREMEVDVFYIRRLSQDERGLAAKKLKSKWKLLYPHLNIDEISLQRFARNLRIRPTAEELEGAREKYEAALASSQEPSLELVQESEEENLRGKKKKVDWTSQVYTDLIYIATQFSHEDRLYNLELKHKWDEMNPQYNFLSVDVLLKCLKGLKKKDFVPNVAESKYAKIRYERLPPINKEALQRTVKSSTQTLVHQHRFKLRDILEYHKRSLAHAVENTQQWELENGHSSREFWYFSDHNMHHYPYVSEHDTGSSSFAPHPTRSVHFLGGRSSAPHEYQNPEFTQDLSAPIHSPPFFPEFEHSPDNNMHYNPNVSGHEVGGSSSTLHLFHSDYFPGGGTSPSHEYNQLKLTQDLSAPIHSPVRLSEFGHLHGCNLPNSPYDPAHDPYLYYPNPYPGEGSSSRSSPQKPPKS